MALSSNPFVIEVQSGISFAFRPIQGAVHGAAAQIASVAQAIGEIDRLRIDNALLLAENERLGVSVTDWSPFESAPGRLACAKRSGRRRRVFSSSSSSKDSS